MSMYRIVAEWFRIYFVIHNCRNQSVSRFIWQMQVCKGSREVLQCCIQTPLVHKLSQIVHPRNTYRRMCLLWTYHCYDDVQQFFTAITRKLPGSQPRKIILHEIISNLRTNCAFRVPTTLFLLHTEYE